MTSNFVQQPEHIKNIIDEVRINTSVKKGIISLSGGVDSMILSYILKYIGIDIIAVHINYNNRPECKNECDILRQWCNFLGIKLYIRKIVEIQRSEMMEYNMRELYETYTRDIRFNTYINAEKNSDINVFLGHNHDDQFENIFTNIVSQSHSNNLCGMEIQSNIQFKSDTINFIRPMLNIQKKDIYKFASYFSILHFKDSTPSWSQRGKIRDIIRPSIEEWDKRAIPSFFNLSHKLTDLTNISQMYTDLLYRNIIDNNKELEVDLNNLYPKILFEMIFNKMEIKITQKSLTAFYEKLIFIKKNKQKFEINSIQKYRLNKDIVIKWKNILSSKIILDFNCYRKVHYLSLA